MNTNCDIESVGERISHTVSELQERGAISDSPKELYDLHEQLAIQILDSEHIDWPDGILSCYLQTFLYCTQKSLGVAETL